MLSRCEHISYSSAFCSSLWTFVFHLGVCRHIVGVGQTFVSTLTKCKVKSSVVKKQTQSVWRCSVEEVLLCAGLCFLVKWLIRDQMFVFSLFPANEAGF